MATITDITPTVDVVGSLIAIRTIDANDVEQGTFTADTRPTDEQAADLCEVAARDTFLALGVEVLDGALVDDAVQVAALRAAQLIELSYYPEQEARAVPTLTAAYLAGVAALQERLHWSPVRLA